MEKEKTQNLMLENKHPFCNISKNIGEKEKRKEKRRARKTSYKPTSFARNADENSPMKYRQDTLVQPRLSQSPMSRLALPLALVLFL